MGSSLSRHVLVLLLAAMFHSQYSELVSPNNTPVAFPAPAPSAVWSAAANPCSTPANWLSTTPALGFPHASPTPAISPSRTRARISTPARGSDAGRLFASSARGSDMRVLSTARYSGTKTKDARGGSTDLIGIRGGGKHERMDRQAYLRMVLQSLIRRCGHAVARTAFCSVGDARAGMDRWSRVVSSSFDGGASVAMRL